MAWGKLSWHSCVVWYAAQVGRHALSCEGNLNQRALEDDAAIERGHSVPELFPQRRLNLRAFGELAAEIDQASEGPDQIPFMPAICITHQPSPILFAGRPTIGRCQVAYLDRHRQGVLMGPLYLMKLLRQSSHALQSFLEITVLLEQRPRGADFTFPRLFAQTGEQCCQLGRREAIQDAREHDTGHEQLIIMA